MDSLTGLKGILETFLHGGDCANACVFFRLQNVGGAYGGGAGGGMGNNVPVEALAGAAYGGNNGIFYPHAAVAQQQQQAMMQQVRFCVGCGVV